MMTKLCFTVIESVDLFNSGGPDLSTDILQPPPPRLTDKHTDRHSVLTAFLFGPCDERFHW